MQIYSPGFPTADNTAEQADTTAAVKWEKKLDQE